MKQTLTRVVAQIAEKIDNIKSLYLDDTESYCILINKTRYILVHDDHDRYVSLLDASLSVDRVHIETR